MEVDRQKALLRDRGICVVIPTYNNEGTIESVVRGAMEECQDVIVVCDGATDRTGEILRGIEGITLVEYAENKGKGYALRRGFEKALEKGFAYAITLDGDGQHYTKDIGKFLEANRKHPGALIVGNRNLENVDRSKGSSFANKFANFWFFVQTGKRLEDTQTGYRLYPIKKLWGLKLLTYRYEAELELLVFSSWHGVQIESIPIDVYYPPREERVSHFRPTMDFVRISILNTVLCFLAVIYGLPLRLWRFFMKYGRTYFDLIIFVVFSFLVVTPGVWLYVKIGKMSEKKRMGIHKFMQWVSRFLLFKTGVPGIDFSSKVAEGVTFDEPRVIICNHQSHFDLLCQLIFTPKIIFLTNNWVWNNPFYGFMIRNAEYYPVAEGIDSLMPKLKSLRDRGYSIAIFPEGTRSKDCSIGRFHQGAFHVAEQLGVDILPMYLYGPGKVLPKGARTIKKGPVYIEVGEVVSREELSGMGDNLQQASAMRRRYIEKYESISNRIEQDV
ncbi:MAG: glycosyltransferase [Bacteroidales bacterium]|nr:glycosyltransferase [Bacteroidales bacterium]